MVSTSLMGKVGFEGYPIHCIIGELPHERESEQEIIVDLLVETDFSKVALSDNLQDTIDYVRLAAICCETAQKGRYHMIETYASEVTTIILKEPTIHSVWIKVKKPGAINRAQWAVTELKRSKS